MAARRVRKGHRRLRERRFCSGWGAKPKGLWQDCVTPVMQGEPRTALAKPLPVIDPQIKAACVAVRTEEKKTA